MTRTSTNRLMDVMEKRVAQMYNEAGQETPFVRNSVHVKRLRGDVRDVLTEVVDQYAGFEGDTEMLMLMLREDIAQL